MSFRKIVGACVLVGAMTGGVVHAEDSGYYIGAGIGQSRQKFTDFDGKDTSFKLYGGWSFNKYFAVEAGYINGGTQSDSFEGVNLDISNEGLFVEGLAKWPLGSVVAPYAKFGYVFYESTAKLSSGSQSVSETESDSDFIYGGGLEFKLGDNVRLRAEYEEVNLPDTAFDNYTLAISWKF